VANECIPVYEDGDNLPCVATAAVTGKKCVQVSATREGTLQTTYAPPPYVPDLGLDTTASGDRIKVSPPSGAGANGGAGKRVLGVAAWDAAIGQEVTVLRDKVVPITVAAAVVAGQWVECTADGSVQPVNTGVAIGYCVRSQATIGQDAEILVFDS
jgi:Uncharacterized conserved protein (DUF2190)